MSPNKSFKLPQEKNQKIFFLIPLFPIQGIQITPACLQASSEGEELYFKHSRSKIPKLINLFGQNGTSHRQAPMHEEQVLQGEEVSEEVSALFSPPTNRSHEP